jgi:hypothetical protein
MGTQVSFYANVSRTTFSHRVQNEIVIRLHGKAGGVAHVGECPPTMYETLSSNSGTSKKKKKRNT